jgi:hypothetical protein
MSARTYVITASIVFVLVALVHLLRLFMQWQVIIDGHNLPMWTSVLGALVAGALGFAGFRVVQQIQRYLT